MTWYTDRSRYMRGFECRWKRLLGYHAFGGIVATYVSAPLATGRYVHAVLEKLLLRLKAGEQHDNWMQITNQDLIQVLAAYRDEVENSRGILGEDKLDHQLDLVVGMAHGYARTVLPFVQEHFTILEVEQERNFQLPSNIVWMCRPDFIAKSKPTDGIDGNRSVHDFKSTSYWNEEEGPRQWMNSVQMMANAHIADSSYYYMHMMVKGNKKYPNLLTTAYYRPGNPPFNKDEWSSKYTRAKMFSKVRVADYRPLPEWIWEVDSKELASKFPVVGPYTVHPYTVNQFFTGVESEELWWKNNLAGLGKWEEEWKKPSFQAHLDHTFPRTFECHTFTGQRCQFYDICHKPDDTWKDPLASDKFVRRDLNHPQEREK